MALPHDFNPPLFESSFKAATADGRLTTRAVPNLSTGITLRDLFAACALASSRAIDRPRSFLDEPEQAETYAAAAYALADAMLERREKGAA